LAARAAFPRPLPERFSKRQRPAGSAFQSGQVIGIKTILPPVEGLGRNPVVPAGLPDVPASGVEIEPTESPGGILGNCPLPNQECDEVKALRYE